MIVALRVLIVALAALSLSGCVSTVSGIAVRAHHAGLSSDLPDVPAMTEADLDRVLLSIGDLNGIMGATGLRIDKQFSEMTDHTDDVSDPECLGAIYGAEEQVYATSGWTALRDEVVRERGDGNDHWVEQIAVLYPSEAKSAKFFELSHDQWQNCAGTSIETYGDDFTYWWDIEDLNATDAVLSQTVRQRDADGWACQHTLAVASNLIVEAWACSYDIGDEAQAIVSDMLANAAKK